MTMKLLVSGLFKDDPTAFSTYSGLSGMFTMLLTRLDVRILPTALLLLCIQRCIMFAGITAGLLCHSICDRVCTDLIGYLVTATAGDRRRQPCPSAASDPAA